MKAPTMTDVARRAGVSHATVSRIINGRAGVSAKAEENVRRAIAELQYLAPPSSQRPGRTPKRPAETSCRHIALLTFDRALTEHSAFVASIYEGARKAAVEQGIAVSLLSLDDFDTVPSWIHLDNVDGLLLHGLKSRGHLTRAASEIPSLWLTTHEDGGVDAVLPGNEAVGRLAAQFLSERGHRHVASVVLDEKNPSYQVRVEAFKNESRRIGMRTKSVKGASKTGGNQKDERLRMEELISKLAKRKKADRPTGLFVPSDRMSALAYAACRSCGLEPGKDFEFVSCDNESAYLTGLFPRPATIDLGTEARGRLALELLLSRIQNPGIDRRATLTLEPTLIPSPD
ncbi:MAG: LacI family DNA-binding transcriptional regulator [Verrucomicrobiota bacterium]